MGDAFASQPEFFEVDVGESLSSRTDTLASFRELGPPDLCHVIKTTGKAGGKDIGSYHYVSGVDASSSAALAAYINSLTYELDANPAWFSTKGLWKLKSGTYCCFNAFSRVDIRVEVSIPGSVEAYVVDLRGEKHSNPSPEIWQEVYLSALLRSILYADDPNYRLAGYRKLDPIASLEAEHRFLQAAENLFFKGWQLGSDPEIQVATVVSNHLSNGIIKYFGEANRYEHAVNLFEKLYAREPEVAALVAQSYIGMNEEMKAVQTMHNAVKGNSQSYALLHVQADFLRSRQKYDWALKLARHAVNSAPSEFSTWAKLTECYIDLQDWESALFTLNSCPMFTYNERDLHRMPPPSRSHLPVKQFISDSNLLNEDNPKDNEADVALLRLPAPALRGTFAKAYALLTNLVSQIGWDELLKKRSLVFVMEEEYRNQKSGQEPRSTNAAESLAGVNAAAKGEVNGSAAPGASQNGPSAEAKGETAGDAAPAANGDAEKAGESDAVGETAEKLDRLGVSSGGNASSYSIPTIRISTESDDEQEKNAAAEEKSTEEKQEANGTAPAETAKPVEVPAPPLEKPAQAQPAAGHMRTDSASAHGATATGPAATEAASPGSTATAAEGQTDGSSSAFSSLSTKRLCERWLDNLFMVLYEDLRVYTIWRAEMNHYKAQNVPYNKTGMEWEILGELALRLHHKEEAKEAFQKAVETRFSVKAYLALLDMYTEQKDLRRALWTCIKLTAYHHRWYMEGSFPGAVAKAIFTLVRSEGLAKVSYTLVSMSPPQPILRLMQNYFAYAQLFRVPGFDW